MYIFEILNAYEGVKKQYELLRLSLNDNELKTLEDIIEKRQNETIRCNPFFMEVFNNWRLIMFPNNESQIEILDRKDIAFEIAKLRIERGYNSWLNLRYIQYLLKNMKKE